MHSTLPVLRQFCHLYAIPILDLTSSQLGVVVNQTFQYSHLPLSTIQYQSILFSCLGSRTMKTCIPYAAMVLVQLAYSGSNILMKIALLKGLNPLVFIVYRHLIAMLILGPLAYVLERKQRPSISFTVMMKIFVLASLGTTVHINVYYAGLAFTTPTVASALSNVIPTLTFIMAVLLGIERVSIGTASGKAKVLGTLTCIAGSLVFTFWKGGYLFKALVDKPLIDIYDATTKNSAHESIHGKENWIKGSALILSSYTAWTAWLILQSVVYKIYPARLSMNVLICFFASVQSSILALFFARNRSMWRLEWNVQLFTIIYCGVVISALSYYLQTWCISKNGPVFAAMFSPLLLIIVGLFSAITFAEQLHLGTLIGAILIIIGLYCVLWGKKADNVVQGPCENTKGNANHEDSKI